MSEQDQPHDPHRRSGYDPNQPREPAGRSTGGQWSATGSHDGGIPRKVVRDTTGEEAWNFFYNMYRPDGSLAEQVVFNRDRSRILSEFNDAGGAEDWDERHTVIAPDGGKLTFETSGDTQTIYDGEGEPLSATAWTKNGLEQQALVQPVLFRGAGRTPGAPAGRDAQKGRETLFTAAAALFTWLSSRNDPTGTAVFAFRADAYRTVNDPEKRDAVLVGRLTEEQVRRACPQYGVVQDETTKAAKALNRADYSTAKEYGTAVHTNLHRQIVGLKEPDLRSEVSIIKTLEETGELPRPELYESPYGRKGSIRVDVLENTKTDTVCVYDIKTGMRRLYPGHTAEIAGRVQLRFPGAKTIIVIEMRPQR